MASGIAGGNVLVRRDTSACDGRAAGTRKRFGAGSGTPPGSVGGAPASARK